jgi:hypothetical protein
MSPAFSLTRYAIWIRRKAKRDYWSPPQSSAFLGSGYPGNFRTSTSGGTLTAEGINLDFTYGFTPAAPVPGPIAGAGLPRPDLGWWWPSRLVATAARRSPELFQTRAAASACSGPVIKSSMPFNDTSSSGTNSPKGMRA